MATYKKQLRDKDGNTIYPDVGLELDNVVYSDDPSEPIDNIIDPNSYSTTEKWTGGYWVDGKKIYKKTIDFGALPNATTKSVSIGATNVGHYIKFEGVAWTSTGTTLNFPLVSPYNVTYQVGAYIDNGSIVVQAGDNKSGYSTCYVTVCYTKTS